MNWIPLTQVDQISDIIQSSKQKPVLVFKHSTTCSISNTSLNRLERNWKPEDMPVDAYYLDLLSYRAISNQIADQFQVEHQSPQVLIIQNGQSIYNASHFDIDYTELKKKISSLPDSKN
ncbi:MAG: bacillithiol system redox-active protein YtxJ [Bacteroidetes bacterium]|nr:bacillithiol system redox-active protein YtxJ [Bacteroidota bacterium]